MKVICCLLSLGLLLGTTDGAPRGLRNLKVSEKQGALSKKGSKLKAASKKAASKKGAKSGGAGPKPLILDTDYGAFIDDVFALGLLINSGDLLDLRFVLTTSIDAPLSAKCVAKHLDIADRTDIKVGAGEPFPSYSERGGVCAIPGFVQSTLTPVCENVTLPYYENGIEAMVDMLMKSKRKDWWYLAIGAQSSVKTLIEKYPKAAEKIETLVIEGGNWCGGFDPYPGVSAPTDETNISCDIGAANAVASKLNPIKRIVYAPVEIADTLSGTDYSKFVNAATSGANGAAKATLDFYEFWSTAARSQPSNLVHAEANTYNPRNESTPQFDPCAVMVALELLDDPSCENRTEIFEFGDGVHFLDAGQGASFPNAPRSSFSLRTDTESFKNLPPECPYLTNYTFDPEVTPDKEIPIQIALGYKSPEAKARFFADMASRMAGEKLKCS